MQALVGAIDGRLDLDTSPTVPADALRTNDIGHATPPTRGTRCRSSRTRPRHGGSFLLIHPSDGATLAAGIVRD